MTTEQRIAAAKKELELARSLEKVESKIAEIQKQPKTWPVAAKFGWNGTVPVSLTRAVALRLLNAEAKRLRSAFGA